MQMLIEVINNGWPVVKQEVSKRFWLYFHIREEMVVSKGLVVKASRAVIPAKFHPTIIDHIHYAHLGVVGCLRRDCFSVFRPDVNAEVRDKISQCDMCNEPRSQS